MPYKAITARLVQRDGLPVYLRVESWDLPGSPYPTAFTRQVVPVEVLRQGATLPGKLAAALNWWLENEAAP